MSGTIFYILLWCFMYHYIYICIHTLWLFNIAMENGPFIDGLPSYKMVDLSMAMLNNQMVYDYICIYKKTQHIWLQISPITPDLWWSSQLSDLWKLLVDGVSVGAGFSHTFGTKSPIFGWKWGMYKTRTGKKPSGKRLDNYGKSPCSMGKSTN